MLRKMCNSFGQRSIHKITKRCFVFREKKKYSVYCIESCLQFFIVLDTSHVEQELCIWLVLKILSFSWDYYFMKTPLPAVYSPCLVAIFYIEVLLHRTPQVNACFFDTVDESQNHVILQSIEMLKTKFRASFEFGLGCSKFRYFNWNPTKHSYTTMCETDRGTFCQTFFWTGLLPLWSSHWFTRCTCDTYHCTWTNCSRPQSLRASS